GYGGSACCRSRPRMNRDRAISCSAVEKPTDNRPARSLCYLAGDAPDSAGDRPVVGSASLNYLAPGPMTRHWGTGARLMNWGGGNRRKGGDVGRHGAPT